ncbi:MAG: pyridoxamine 5'-phosphate oxidase family protein [Candidatus Margulisbacteria bacterium]|jgi:uncharacterized pyridoxamine 5'-phosphate oxidase family protein|nr:pyridoxamine 5'-phosphate oxidase family protein [Candidatus Margulisiibacteriota bacterium]
MSEAIKFLQDNPLHYVATVGLDGRPSVRPFQSIYVKDGRIYYCTGNFKTVYQELQKNPAVQINALDPKTMDWARLSGRAVFTDDAKIKEEFFAAYPNIKERYPEISTFAVFYIDQPKATLYSFSAPPREIFL